MWGIEARYYEPVFNYVSWALCIILCLMYMQSPNNKNLLTPKSSLFTFVFVVIITLFLGLRPDKWWWFGDSDLYAHHYENIAVGANTMQASTEAEWFFAGIESVCKYLGFNVHLFFLIVAIFYVVLWFITCQMLIWENTWMAMLFVISSFSFYSFGINGIRTGMATSLILVGLAIFTKKNRWSHLLAIGLFILAFGTHRSMMLPIAMTFVAYFFVKNPVHAIYIWLVSIVVSLVGGSSVQDFIVGFVGAEDVRMKNYSSFGSNDSFAHTGFRWDFLAYSSVPVLLTYYMVVKRGIQDKTYNFLATVYILSNACWVLVIRMAYTNRFAFLSWFMYPLVLAYALIRVHIWEDQDKKAAYFLLGSTAFSIILYALGK